MKNQNRLNPIDFKIKICVLMTFFCSVFCFNSSFFFSERLLGDEVPEGQLDSSKKNEKISKKESEDLLPWLKVKPENEKYEQKKVKKEEFEIEISKNLKDEKKKSKEQKKKDKEKNSNRRFIVEPRSAPLPRSADLPRAIEMMKKKDTSQNLKTFKRLKELS